MKLERTMLELAPEFWRDRIRPGAHPAELLRWERCLQIDLPPLLREFFLWRGFSDCGKHLEFQWPGTLNTWGYQGSGLVDVIAHHEFLCQMHGADLESPDGCEPGLEGVSLHPGRWNVKWIPVFLGIQGGDCFCVDMAGLFGGPVGQMVEYDERSSERHFVFSSFEEYLELFMASVEEGLWTPESETDAEPGDREHLREFFMSRATSPVGTIRLDQPSEPPTPETEFVESSLVDFEFKPGPDYNGVNPPLRQDTVVVRGSIGPRASGGEFLNLKFVDSSGDRSRTLIVSIEDERGLRTGYRYQVSASLLQSIGSSVTLYDVTTDGGERRENQRWLVSEKTKGAVVITEMDDQRVELEFQFAGVERRPDRGQAQGCFDVSGVVQLCR